MPKYIEGNDTTALTLQNKHIVHFIVGKYAPSSIIKIVCALCAITDPLHRNKWLKFELGFRANLYDNDEDDDDGGRGETRLRN